MPTRAVSEPTNIMELGLAIATISRDLVTKFDLPGNQKGVVVTEVSPDGSAAKHGIKAGDVILAIQQAEVDAPLAVQKEVDAAKKDGRSSVLMLTQQRHGPTLYVPVPLPRSIDPHGGCRFATITTRSEHADAGRV
jgi:serine protease Do